MDELLLPGTWAVGERKPSSCSRCRPDIVVGPPTGSWDLFQHSRPETCQAHHPCVFPHHLLRTPLLSARPFDQQTDTTRALEARAVKLRVCSPRSHRLNMAPYTTFHPRLHFVCLQRYAQTLPTLRPSSFSSGHISSLQRRRCWSSYGVRAHSAIHLSHPPPQSTLWSQSSPTGPISKWRGCASGHHSWNPQTLSPLGCTSLPVDSDSRSKRRSLPCTRCRPTPRTRPGARRVQIHPYDGATIVQVHIRYRKEVIAIVTATMPSTSGALGVAVLHGNPVATG